MNILENVSLYTYKYIHYLIRPPKLLRFMEFLQFCGTNINYCTLEISAFVGKNNDILCLPLHIQFKRI